MPAGQMSSREFLKELLVRESELDEETGCLVWQRPPDGGYGQISARAIQKNPMRTHRLAYLLHVGEIPEGMAVKHVCENKLCVNPDHLYIGKMGEQRRDRCKRGHSPERATRDRNGHLRCRECDTARKKRGRLKDPWMN